MRAFVIAMDCEADCVRPWLGENDRLYLCGIGKVNAAMATARAICEGAEQIVNVGVTGAFGADLSVGEIYGVANAVEFDFDLSKINHTGIGVLNEYDTPYLECDRDISLEKFSWFKGWKTLATADCFSDGNSERPVIVDLLHASLRDMEGAAIAHVCKRMGKRPPLMVKCISDVADKGVMANQYAQNLKICQHNLTEAMGELLRNHALGPK